MTRTDSFKSLNLQRKCNFIILWIFYRCLKWNLPIHSKPLSILYDKTYNYIKWSPQASIYVYSNNYFILICFSFFSISGKYTTSLNTSHKSKFMRILVTLLYYFIFILLVMQPQNFKWTNILNFHAFNCS